MGGLEKQRHLRSVVPLLLALLAACGSDPANGDAGTDVGDDTPGADVGGDVPVADSADDSPQDDTADDSPLNDPADDLRLDATADDDAADGDAVGADVGDDGAGFCGDGIIDGDEACEDGALAGATCESLLGPGQTGTLSCVECSIDTRGCSCTGDLDFDGVACAEDCDDDDPDNWVSCGTCLDDDEDNWFVGCDRYLRRLGNDCDPSSGLHWADCGRCADWDVDGDGFGFECDAGPDCAEGDPDLWASCDTCSDSDGDGFFAGSCDVTGTADCDDDDATVYPGGVEIPLDGVDNDCQPGGELSGPLDAGDGLFVDASVSPGGACTPVDPCSTIDEAFAAASPGPVTIFLATPGAYDIGAGLTLDGTTYPSVQILGALSPGFAARSSRRADIIGSISVTGGAADLDGIRVIPTSDLPALFIGGATTATSITSSALEGFDSPASGAIALDIAGGLVYVADSALHGGGTSVDFGDDSTAIRVQGGELRVAHSDLFAGDGNQSARVVEVLSGALVLRANTLWMGTDDFLENRTVDVNGTSGPIEIVDNTFEAPGGADANTTGVYVSGDDGAVMHPVTIRNNQFLESSCDGSCAYEVAIRVEEGPQTVIVGNRFEGDTAGFDATQIGIRFGEGDGAVGAVFVYDNDLRPGGTYQGQVAGIRASTTDVPARIRGNDIEVGTATITTSFGIEVVGGDPIISHNVLRPRIGGPQNGALYGVFVSGTAARIEDNVIELGMSEVVFGVRGQSGAELDVRNNRIDVRARNDTDSADAYGVLLEGPGHVLQNDIVVSGWAASGIVLRSGGPGEQFAVGNTVVARTQAQFARGIGVESGFAGLANNVVVADAGVGAFAQAYGIELAGTMGSTPSLMSNAVLAVAGGASATACAIFDSACLANLNVCPVDCQAAGNIEASCLIAPGAATTIDPASACVDAARDPLTLPGGWLPPDPPLDRDLQGDYRPGRDRWDIGADEALCRDLDGDGWGVDCASTETDCDDRDPTRYPTAPELADDGVVNDCTGESDNLEALNGQVFVDADNGVDPESCDTPACTLATPCQSLDCAIAVAQHVVGTDRIFLAAGDYTTSSALPNTALYGGYDAGSGWTRDLENTQTVIAGGLVIDGTRVLLEGLQIQQGDAVCAVELLGGGLFLHANRLVGGGSGSVLCDATDSGGRLTAIANTFVMGIAEPAVGVSLDGSVGLFIENRFETPSLVSAAFGYGLVISGSAQATLVNNVLQLGANDQVGVATDSSVRALGNFLELSGTRATGFDAAGSATLELVHNTIVGRASAGGEAVALTGDPLLHASNNLFWIDSSSVPEEGRGLLITDEGPLVYLHGNYVQSSGCAIVSDRTDAPSECVAADAVDGCAWFACRAADGTVTGPADLQDLGDGRFELGEGSICADRVGSAARHALSTSGDLDAFGTERPAGLGHDIGAYERP